MRFYDWFISWLESVLGFWAVLLFELVAAISLSFVALTVIYFVIVWGIHAST